MRKSLHTSQTNSKTRVLFDLGDELLGSMGSAAMGLFRQKLYNPVNKQLIYCNVETVVENTK